MTKYTVNFYTEADWATTEIEADTPEQALSQAYAIEDDEVWMLDFQRYDPGNSVEHIEVRDTDGATVAEWYSPDLCQHLAASDLLQAAEKLVSQIRELHGESSVIDQDLEQGEPFAALCAAIAKAKSGP